MAHYACAREIGTIKLNVDLQIILSNSLGVIQNFSVVPSANIYNICCQAKPKPQLNKVGLI